MEASEIGCRPSAHTSGLCLNVNSLCICPDAADVQPDAEEPAVSPNGCPAVVGDTGGSRSRLIVLLPVAGQHLNRRGWVARNQWRHGIDHCSLAVRQCLFAGFDDAGQGGAGERADLTGVTASKSELATVPNRAVQTGWQCIQAAGYVVQSFKGVASRVYRRNQIGIQFAARPPAQSVVVDQQLVGLRSAVTIAVGEDVEFVYRIDGRRTAFNITKV